MPTDANTLAANSTCIWKCIPDGLKIAALISLFAKAAGVTLDAAGIKNLIDQAKCINCEIPRGLQVAALISLFAGGGVSPTPTPPSPCVNLIPAGAAYDDAGHYYVNGFGSSILQTGVLYQFTWGINEENVHLDTGGSMMNPGAGQAFTEVFGTGGPGNTGVLYFVSATPNSLVTATICAI